MPLISLQIFYHLLLLLQRLLETASQEDAERELPGERINIITTLCSGLSVTWVIV